MSGVDLDGHSIRKGAGDAVVAWVRQQGGEVPPRARDDDGRTSRARAARRSSSPATTSALGVIHLKDIVKGGIRERFDQLRAMGIRTVMITGDNPLTAAVIAKEAGVDDFLAEATPETKMELISASSSRASSWR